jgi:hypothetical protein
MIGEPFDVGLRRAHVMVRAIEIVAKLYICSGVGRAVAMYQQVRAALPSRRK